MRIKSISKSIPMFGDGLQTIEMRCLNRIVVLAGANGAGKTRLLNRIATTGLKIDSRMKGMELDSPTQNLNAVMFVSKNTELIDPANLKIAELSSLAERAETLGANHLVQTTLPYIHRVQNQWREATHPHNPSSELREAKERSYTELQILIKAALGVELSRDQNGNATLFGRPIAQCRLSDGQVALLQWCVALHAQGLSLTEQILLMDEPENHLHPEALIATIERIIAANSQGQIWIATHSVPLIAFLYSKHSDVLSLYFMHDGLVSFASEQPERVLTSLMGGEDNIEALREFIDLPEVFATNRFAAQCLEVPAVVDFTTPTDPQSQIVLAETTTSSAPLKLLDYGCGKGRVLSSLFEEYQQSLATKVDYIGWDVNEKHRSTCENVFTQAYGTGEGRWFSDRQQLAERHSGTFDRVLLCNVLHEIEHTQWVETFNETSVIYQSLNVAGEVLLIEDYLMPKGEYAHPFGFIVLDTEPLQKLFGAKAGEIRVKLMREGRIKGHSIPKRLLANISAASVKQALEFTQRNAKEQIWALRENRNADFKAGRAHGFWVQQYANTTLALS